MTLRVQLPENIDPAEDWCIRVYIPGDIGYLVALRSVLTLLAKWFAWERDESRRGKDAAARWLKADLKTVQAMIDGAYRCDDCGAAAAENTGEGLQAAISGGLIVIGDEMGQVVTDTYIDYTTGELVVKFGECCERRYKLAADAIPPTNEDGDVITEPTDPGIGDIDVQYTPCGKAKWLVNRLRVIGQAAWNNRTDPFSIMAAIKAVNPGYSVAQINVNDLWITTTVLSALEGLGDTDIFNGEFLHRWTCFALSMLEADAQGFTTAEYNKFLFYPYGFAWASEIPDLGTVGDTAVAAFWANVVAILGRERCNQVMQEALNYEPDCGCDEPYEPPAPWPTIDTPTAAGYYVGDTIVALIAEDTGSGNVEICHGWTAGHDIFGFVFDSFHNINAADAATLKRMASGAAEDCGGAYELHTSWFDDTSDELESEPTGKWAFTSASIAAELGADQSRVVVPMLGTPTVPGVVAGTNVAFKFALVSAQFRSVRFVELRPIYNLNSPSHAV